MAKNIDWGSLGFGYMETDKSYVSLYTDGNGTAAHLPQTTR